MLEAITGAGYDLELVRDLWTILGTGWTESEVRFVVLAFALILAPWIRRLF